MQIKNFVYFCSIKTHKPTQHNTMKIDNKFACKVSIRNAEGAYITTIYDGYASLQDIRNAVKKRITWKAKVQVSVSQDGGYFREFNMMTR